MRVEQKLVIGSEYALKGKAERVTYLGLKDRTILFGLINSTYHIFAHGNLTRGEDFYVILIRDRDVVLDENEIADRRGEYEEYKSKPLDDVRGCLFRPRMFSRREMLRRIVNINAKEANI